MSSVLEFIQKEVKLNHTTISKFIEGNFNRTRFYKLMNSTESISENDILIFSNALNLDKEKEQELRLIIKQANSKYGNTQIEKILKLLYTHPAFINQKAPEVELFSMENSRNRTIKSYKEIIESFDLENGVKIKIQIQNCLSFASLISLYSFLSQLRTTVTPKSLEKDIHIEIEHLLTMSSINVPNKIALVLNIAHLIQFPKYSIFLLEQRNGNKIEESDIYNFLENTVLIEELHDNKNSDIYNRYLILHLSNIEGKRDYCFESQERNYYEFYNTIFNGLKAEVSKQNIYCSLNAININSALSKFESYSRLVINKSPCLDSICPDILKVTLKNALEIYPDKINLIRKLIDKENQFSYLNNDDFMKLQVDFLDKRFYCNEKNSSVNIYDVQSFISFLNTGEIKDVGNILSLNKNSLKQQLLYFLNREQKHYGDNKYQQFYFLKNAGTISDFVFSIFDTMGMSITNTKCQNMFDSNIFFPDVEMAKELYNIIINSLSDDKILSKEETIKFLHEQILLLGGTEREIADYIEQNND